MMGTNDTGGAKRDSVDANTSPASPTSRSSLLKRGGLADDVADYVREQILTGGMKPGTHIDQQAISDALGVSRSPIREAIVVLGQEGLVDVLPRRGAQVSRLSRDDVIDHYELFGLVAGRAAAIAATELPDSQLERLQELHSQFDSSLPSDMSALNNEFHRSINLAAPRRTRWLLRMLERTVPSGYYEFVAGWDEQAIVHHNEILVALLARDSQGARMAMEYHLHQSGVAAAQALEDQGLWSSQ